MAAPAQDADEDGTDMQTAADGLEGCVHDCVQDCIYDCIQDCVQDCQHD